MEATKLIGKLEKTGCHCENVSRQQWQDTLLGAVYKHQSVPRLEVMGAGAVTAEVSP